MDIRNLVASDLEKLSDLCSQLGYPCTCEELAARFKEIQIAGTHALFAAEKAHRFYLREGYAIAKSWHLFTKQL